MVCIIFVFVCFFFGFCFKEIISVLIKDEIEKIKNEKKLWEEELKILNKDKKNIFILEGIVFFIFVWSF